MPRDQVEHVLHGTTIATNAVLEHDGACAGMILLGALLGATAAYASLRRLLLV